ARHGAGGRPARSFRPPYSHDARGKERRRGCASQVGRVRGRQVLQHVSVLLLEGGGDGHHPLNEAAAVLAVGAERQLSIDDRGTDASFRDIVRELHALDVHKGEEGLLQLEHLLGHTGRLAAGAYRGLPEPPPESSPYGLHPALEGAPGEGAVTDAVPPLEHQLRLGEQLSAYGAALAASVHKALPV